AWIYEYFPEFRPATRHDWTEEQPHVQKWVIRIGRSRVVDQEAALHDYRIQLNRMTVDVITWTHVWEYALTSESLLQLLMASFIVDLSRSRICQIVYSANLSLS
ncbi:hypothetical protein Dimus_012440, partial [Dionaea muscipula]